MGARLTIICKTNPPWDYNTITSNITPCSFGRVVMRELTPCKRNQQGDIYTGGGLDSGRGALSVRAKKKSQRTGLLPVLVN